MPSDARKPLWIVMRLDDVHGSRTDAVTIMKWFKNHQVKLNLGLVLDGWTASVQKKPVAGTCDNAAFVQNAYEDGHILGTGPGAALEIASHSFNHDGWVSQWQGLTPEVDWATVT